MLPCCVCGLWMSWRGSDDSSGGDILNRCFIYFLKDRSDWWGIAGDGNAGEHYQTVKDGDDVRPLKGLERFVKKIEMERKWGKRLMETITTVNVKLAYASFYNRYTKRVLDILITGMALLVLWPFYFIISVAIVLEDGFPVFYRAERGGYQNHSFYICKFRSMVKNADRIGGGTTALHDSRITKVGNFLRKTKLDEIPQLLQVFLGKMSLIGPRPELMKYVNQYVGDEKQILEVRPGITDYSSVEFINLDEIVGGENADEMYEKHVLKRKNELRIKYAQTVSFKTDVKLLFLTVWKVLEKAFGFVVKKKHR